MLHNTFKDYRVLFFLTSLLKVNFIYSLRIHVGLLAMSKTMRVPVTEVSRTITALEHLFVPFFPSFDIHPNSIIKRGKICFTSVFTPILNSFVKPNLKNLVRNGFGDKITELVRLK